MNMATNIFIYLRYCFRKEAVNTEDSNLLECYAVYEVCLESIEPF